MLQVLRESVMSNDCQFKSDGDGCFSFPLAFILFVAAMITCDNKAGENADKLNDMQHQLNRIEKRQIWKGQ